VLLFVGDDWSEDHHDIELQDHEGKVLARRRLPEGVAGVTALHELVGEHSAALEVVPQVVVGIETDRGAWVQALLAAGYEVFAINPMSVARYRERHTTSGAKSDPGDAHVLADLVRTDRDQHRPIAGDSELAEAIKVLARAHQSMGWMRGQQANQLRSTLREFYPAALEAFESLTSSDALAVLAVAPTPGQGRGLSVKRIETALRRGGRQRYVKARAEAIHAALGSEQLSQPPLVAEAFGASVAALVGVLVASVAAAQRSRGSSRPLSASTRPLSCTDPSPAWDQCSVPGCSPSSGTTRPVTSMPRPARTTPAPRRSPRPRARAMWCWPGTRPTSGCETHYATRPSPP
jgi:hypothetical protein